MLQYLWIPVLVVGSLLLGAQFERWGQEKLEPGRQRRLQDLHAFIDIEQQAITALKAQLAACAAQRAARCIEEE